MTPRWLWGLLLSACTNANFAPETLVKNLRVLSVSAEPPEVGPAEVSRLSVLKTDAAPGVPTTVLWVGCEPDPQDLGRSACNNASILLRPTEITDYPEGLQLLGFGLTASYRSTATVFNSLSAESSIRWSGSVGQILGLVIGEDIDPLATGDKLREYFARIERKETPVVIALTRVLVSEKPLADRNKNPGIVRLVVDNVPLAKDARIAVLPGQQVSLSVQVPDDVRQTYVERQPGGDITKTETVVGAWYSTSGRFSRERFDAAAGEDTLFTAPGSDQFPEDPVPERRTGTVWLVIRDDRGGQSFERYSLFVCDPSLPDPIVTSVMPTGIGGQAVATGENLQGVLDITVGTSALARGTANESRTNFVGDAPALEPGSYEIRIRARNCNEQILPFPYVVPGP